MHVFMKRENNGGQVETKSKKKCGYGKHNKKRIAAHKPGKKDFLVLSGGNGRNVAETTDGAAHGRGRGRPGNGYIGRKI